MKNFRLIQQGKIFNEVQDWAKKKMKARNSNEKLSVDTLRLFITGGAGVVKSHLMKTICMFLTKTINLYSGSPDKTNVLILAPTGVVAINIDRTTLIQDLVYHLILTDILCQGFQILNED